MDSKSSDRNYTDIGIQTGGHVVHSGHTKVIESSKLTPTTGHRTHYGHQRATPQSIRSDKFVDLGYDSLHSTPKQLITCTDHPPLLTRQNPIKELNNDNDGRSRISESINGNRQTSSSSGPGFNIHEKSNRFEWLPRKLDDDDSGKENSKIIGQDVDTNSSSSISSTKNSEREEWGKKIDFLLSIIGFAVDLSNVWRFPYLCYKNGGGVFLIPYSTMLLFGALPLFFMELSLGQWAKTGPISLWDKICPPMKGIGYCFVLISWYVSFYYNVIIAWTTSYVIKTLISGDLMPWQHCDNWYNTEDCISMEEIKQLKCKQANHRDLLDIHTHQSQINQSLPLKKLLKNSSSIQEPFDIEMICQRLSNRTSPTEEFFNRGLLEIDQSKGLESLGHIRLELVGCLLIVFIILYFSLFKGVKSSGKVVWVTATAPYFILTILLIRGLFLPGSRILYYINPQMHKLLEPMVWVDAAVQVFYSIGIGFGVHLTYASFNKYNNNCYRDCLITASVNSLTSFYSGFVIFTYLGYMATSMNKEIENVASEGYGLVFQVYPEAISTLPFAKFWSLLFFFMLLTLGIDSAMGGIEAVITGIMDEFNLHKRFKREYFTGIVISASFLGSLINCTQGGAFTMVWFDTYSAGISLIASAMFETLVVMYIYGAEKFCLDIESMIGHRPSRYFVYSWKYISPVFLTTIIIMSIINSESITYYGYNFPLWATISGWCFTLSSITFIPLYALFYYIRQYYQTVSTNTTATPDSIKATTKSLAKIGHSFNMKDGKEHNEVLVMIASAGADRKSQQDKSMPNNVGVYV